MLILGGCNVIGYGLSAIPQKIEAQYTPPKTPILVLVENQQNPGMTVDEGDELTGYILDELATYEVAPLVEMKKLQDLRDSGTNVDKMTISQIGKAVGAEQVLYVDLRRVNVGEAVEGIPLHGRLDATVRIVEVKTGRTSFPVSGSGTWPVTFETPITQDTSRANPRTIRESLLRAAGTTIGQLFHDRTEG